MDTLIGLSTDYFLLRISSSHYRHYQVSFKKVETQR